MDNDLTIPATRELLDGWRGPALFATNTHEVVILRLVLESDGLCAEVYSLLTGKVFRTALGMLKLDLSRAECRDRVCRVLAAKVRVFAGLSAPWFRGDGRGEWKLDGDPPREGEVWHARWSARGVARPEGIPALSDLDPNDDTRLPDGSRRVDAQALRWFLGAFRMEPTPADLAAHVAALPAEERVAVLVALLRACPGEAVRINGGGYFPAAKVAPPWRQAADGTGHQSRSGVVSVLGWGRRGAGLLASRTSRQWSWRSPHLPGPTEPATGGLNDTSGTFWAAPEEAMAAADAALLADGWVLAGVPRG